MDTKSKNIRRGIFLFLLAGILCAGVLALYPWFMNRTPVPENLYPGSPYYVAEVFGRNFFLFSGFLIVSLTALGLVMLMTHILSMRGFTMGALTRTPLEFAIPMLLLTVLWGAVAVFLAGLIHIEMLEIPTLFLLTGSNAVIAGYCFAGLALVFTCFFAIVSVNALAQFFVLRPLPYLQERVLTVMFMRWTWHAVLRALPIIWGWCKKLAAGLLSLASRILGMVKSLFNKLGSGFGAIVGAVRGVFSRFGGWLRAHTLMEQTHRTLLTVTIVNFVAVGIMCCFWFYGVVILVLYSLAVYLIARKYIAVMENNYKTLLGISRDMAEGQLSVEIEDDLGIFATLGGELRQIQNGFRRAVDAEIRSQNMRTDLIANVSHDLKTPLTAIITYVDLLRESGLSEEERQRYVETLDQKSQRLKVLIEDLFEVSRASSGNITLTMTDIDLPELIRQVETELISEIQASGIDLRRSFPAERVQLQLDGEKTSRVFENLIMNIVKYSLPNTRAYIDMSVEGGWVCVELKNISREMPNFDPGTLTERFVRGDRSRNTEGSGLGLAIAKSFTELQGGTLEIVTDGDLFKVLLRFRQNTGDINDKSGQ